jgi:hypothetical protein
MENKILEFMLVEYEKLKEEQKKRIEFRDNMIYLTLASIGGVFAFAFDKLDWNEIFLILPFICIVLGWTYLINDLKISEIGDYLRTILIPKIKNLDSKAMITDNNWENYHLTVGNRKVRKYIQLVIDLLLFCFSAFISIGLFFYLNDNYLKIQLIIALFECLLILYLLYQIVYAARIHNG